MDIAEIEIAMSMLAGTEMFHLTINGDTSILFLPELKRLQSTINDYLDGVEHCSTF